MGTSDTKAEKSLNYLKTKTVSVKTLLCLLGILSWISSPLLSCNINGSLLSSSRTFLLYVSGVFLVSVQLLSQLEVAPTHHSVIDLKLAGVPCWAHSIFGPKTMV